MSIENLEIKAIKMYDDDSVKTIIFVNINLYIYQYMETNKKKLCFNITVYLFPNTWQTSKYDHKYFSIDLLEN